MQSRSTSSEGGPPPPPPSLPHPSERQRRRRVDLFAYALTTPSLAVLGAIAAAVAWGAYLSLTNYSFYRPITQFVGIKNYVNALSNPAFLSAFRTTLFIATLAVTLETVGGLFVALLLSSQLRGIRAIRVIVCIPLMVPVVISAIMWKVMMAGSGIINHLLSFIHITGPGWLNDPTWAPIAILIIDFWINMPFAALVILAGLQSLPGEPLEAALVDGASGRQQLLYVILPLLRPFIMLVIAFRLMDALQLFDIVYATTLGGPGNATLTLPVYGYQIAFLSGAVGYAAAMGIFLFVLVFVASRIALRLRVGSWQA